MSSYVIAVSRLNRAAAAPIDERRQLIGAMLATGGDHQENEITLPSGAAVLTPRRSPSVAGVETSALQVQESEQMPG